MTIDVTALRERLRLSADAAAQVAATRRAEGRDADAEFASGRQAAFLTALNLVNELEREAYAERAAERDGRFAVNGVNLGAVEDLEEFARSAGGAVDMASGTVYSDADGGL